MKEVKNIVLIIGIVIVTSCAPTLEPYHFEKVIGITYAGDSILIDVNSLRPRIYNNTYHYNNNTVPYYYRPYLPQLIIKPNSISNTNSNHNPKPVIVKPNIVIPSASNKPIVSPSNKPNKIN